MDDFALKGFPPILFRALKFGLRARMELPEGMLEEGSRLGFVHLVADEAAGITPPAVQYRTSGSIPLGFWANSWGGPKGEEVGCEGEVDMAEVRCRAEGVPAEGGGLSSVD